MPPSASRTAPRLRLARAGERALSWPNSSLSMRVSGSAAQLRARIGPWRRGPTSGGGCSGPITSLPHAVSPSTSTSTSVSAICRKVLAQPLHGRRSRPISGRPVAAASSAASRKSRRFSITSRRFSAARVQRSATSRSAAKGFGDEIVGAVLECALTATVDVAMPGHQDHRNVRVESQRCGRTAAGRPCPACGCRTPPRRRKSASSLASASAAHRKGRHRKTGELQRLRAWPCADRCRRRSG